MISNQFNKKISMKDLSRNINKCPGKKSVNKLQISDISHNISRLLLSKHKLRVFLVQLWDKIHVFFPNVNKQLFDNDQFLKPRRIKTPVLPFKLPLHYSSWQRKNLAMSNSNYLVPKSCNSILHLRSRNRNFFLNVSINKT